MGIEASLKTYLSAQGGIASLAGSRIYRGHAPQGAISPLTESWLPFIVLQRITGGHEHELSGGAGIAQPTIQIDCIAPTYGQAKELSEAVRAVLQGYSGAMSSDTVRVATLENEIDIIEPPETAAERPVHRVVTDYRIWVLESAPSL